MTRLTDKQDHFARLVAGGAPYSQAYRAAYSSKARPSTIRTEASRLARSEKILRAVDQLMEEDRKRRLPAEIAAAERW